jgi:hypothetical protein
MKKLLICLSMAASVISLYSFRAITQWTGYQYFSGATQDDGEWWISDDDAAYVSNALQNSQVEIDPQVTLYDFNDTDKAAPIGMTVCPGSGVLCLIKLAPDKDGDPVYLASYKAKGKKNIDY